MTAAWGAFCVVSKFNRNQGEDVGLDDAILRNCEFVFKNLTLDEVWVLCEKNLTMLSAIDPEIGAELMHD